MTIKLNDFVEIEYTGRLSGQNVIFDTTDKKLAQEAGLNNREAQYGSVVVCVGQKQLVPGLDLALVGKETAKEYHVEISCEDGFGKKNPQLIQLVPTAKFKKNGLTPMKGLQVSVDGVLATIASVSAGRTLVDFNHPLAGKDLTYTFKVLRIVNDDTEKAKEFVKLSLGLKDAQVHLVNGSLDVTLKSKLPVEYHEKLSSKLKELVPAITEVKFHEENAQKTNEKTPHVHA